MSIYMIKINNYLLTIKAFLHIKLFIIKVIGESSRGLCAFQLPFLQLDKNNSLANLINLRLIDVDYIMVSCSATLTF